MNGKSYSSWLFKSLLTVLFWVGVALSQAYADGDDDDYAMSHGDHAEVKKRSAAEMEKIRADHGRTLGTGAHVPDLSDSHRKEVFDKHHAAVRAEGAAAQAKEAAAMEEDARYIHEHESRAKTAKDQRLHPETSHPYHPAEMKSEFAKKAATAGNKYDLERLHAAKVTGVTIKSEKDLPHSASEGTAGHVTHYRGREPRDSDTASTTRSASSLHSSHGAGSSSGHSSTGTSRSSLSHRSTSSRKLSAGAPRH